MAALAAQNLSPIDAQTATTRARFSQAAMLRAIQRATEERLIPFRNADGTWSVKDYTLTPFGPRPQDVHCSCVAGQSGLACKHWAVVAFARKHHLLPRRPVRPVLTIVKAFEGAEKAARVTDCHRCETCGALDPDPLHIAFCG